VNWKGCEWQRPGPVQNLNFSWWYCRGDESCRMLCCIFGWVGWMVPDVSSDCIAYIIRFR